jgi:integrase
LKRHQRGSIIEKSGAFYVVYRTTVAGERKQIWHQLCTKDRAKGYASPKSSAVQLLAEDHMHTVNSSDGVQSGEDLTIAAFWEQTYLPFIKENLKPSTYLGYQQVWLKHLKPHFGEKTLREYRTPDGSLFLTQLAKTLRPYTVAHTKFLCSGLFSHAVNTGKVETNPWHDCKVLGKYTKANSKTQHYTLEEIENIITALVDHVDAQLIMALAFFLGLRKGEIQGLQWGDIDGGYIHIRRAIVRGNVGTPKTVKSVRSLPIIQPVSGLLKLWRAKNPDGVWVFDRGMMTIARKTIMPTLKKAGLRWKGYHAGRRGLGTVLRQITGNSTAGRDVLGHEDEAVTKDHYEGALPVGALSAMKLLEAKALGK